MEKYKLFKHSVKYIVNILLIYLVLKPRIAHKAYIVTDNKSNII